MLAATMYHHAGDGPFSNPPELLDRQFAYIRKRGIRTVHAGEELVEGPHLCMVFDDAYYDFYHHVYPLLKKHGLKAVLGVPTDFVAEETDAEPGERLAIPHGEALGGALRVRAPLCTWEEINEMTSPRNGYVTVAAHGAAHKEFGAPGAFVADATRAKEAIEERTGRACQTLVSPYGARPQGCLAALENEYDHLFGIGSEKYPDWPGAQGWMLRFPADDQNDATSLIDAIFPPRGWRYRLGRLKRRVRRTLSAGSR